MRFLFVVLICLPSYANSKNFRSDLTRSLGPLFCNNETLPSSSALFEMGVYDSQIIGSVFLNVDPSRLPDLSQPEGYSGYAWGICEGSRKAWALYTRSPEPIIVTGSSLQLATAMKALCRSVAVQAADAEKGASFALPHPNESIIRPSGHGTLSATCFPRQENQGAQTWFLVPFGRGTLKLPGDELLVQEKLTSFQNWLQFIRKREKLSPLTFPPSLYAILNILENAKRVDHDRTLMREAQQVARRRGLVLIGEDRAQGLTMQELAWLLWFSPRHRDLLLDPSGDIAGLSLKRHNGLMRLIFVLAKN